MLFGTRLELSVQDLYHVISASGHCKQRRNRFQLLRILLTYIFAVENVSQSSWPILESPAIFHRIEHYQEGLNSVGLCPVVYSVLSISHFLRTLLVQFAYERRNSGLQHI